MPKARPKFQTSIPQSEAPQDATEVPQEELYEEEGDTGTIISSGILSQQDYNADLTGTQRIRKYDEMRLGDSTVAAALQVVKLPILSAEWYIKPASEDAKHKAQARFIDDQLFKNVNFSWNELLEQILTMCDYGNSIFEKVFEVVDWGEYTGRVGWKKFGQRLSKTIYRWTLEDGKTDGIVQMLPGGKKDADGKTLTKVEIPRWKLLYFINKKEGSNYEGISLLRPAYKHWYMKDAYYRIDAIAAERMGVGIPIITSPPQASPADKAKARQIAKNMRANSAAYADLPQGFTLKMMEMAADKVKDVEKMVLHHDHQILKAVLAEFINLGSQGGSGSYALSNTQANLFYLSLVHLAKTVQQELQHAVDELIDLNFGVQEKYPTLEIGKIGLTDVAALAEALSKYITAGAITVDTELERYLRQAMDLPEAEYIEAGDDGKTSDKDKQKKDEEKPKSGDPEKDSKKETEKLEKLPRLQASEKMESFIEDAEELLDDVYKAIHAKENQS